MPFPRLSSSTERQLSLCAAAAAIIIFFFCIPSVSSKHLSAPSSVLEYKVVELSSDSTCRQNSSFLEKILSMLRNTTELGSLISEVPLTPQIRLLSPECPFGGIHTVIAALTEPRVRATVGNAADHVCEAIASLATVYKKLFVSWSCTASLLSDKTSFPNFARTCASAQMTSRALAAIVSYLGFKYSVILTAAEDHWIRLATATENELRVQGLVVRVMIILTANSTVEEIILRLGTVASPVKAVLLIMDMETPLFSHALTAADEMSLGDGRFAYIAIHEAGILHPRLVPSLPQKSQSILRALFVLTVVDNNSTYERTWENNTAALIFEDLLNNMSVSDAYVFSRLYDAVSLLFSAIKVAVELGADFANLPLDLSQHSRNLQFPTLLGYGFTDANGDRIVSYEILDFEPIRRKFRSVACLVRDNESGFALVEPRWLHKVDWPQDNKLQSDSSCMMTVEGCVEDPVVFPSWSGESSPWALSLGICSVIFMTLLAIIRKKLLFRDMKRKLLLTQDDIQFSNSNKSETSDNFRSTQTTPTETGFDNNLGGNQAVDISNSPLFNIHKRKEISVNKQGLFRSNKNYHFYQGEPVHLRYLSTASNFQVTSTSIRKLCLIYELRHENMNRFLGCMTDPSQPPALVWEYCTRGSLTDVLARTELSLDWPFKLSLLTDLVKGLRYLHSSSLKYHGRMTSRNCIIDSRWMLKLTDFGLPLFHQAHKLSLPQYPAKDLLWTAPEILRNSNIMGSQPGDIYSFSIVMQEVLERQEPFAMLPMDPEEVIMKLKKPPPIIRPSISQQIAPHAAISIMNQCWAEQPALRPTIQQVYDHFKRLNQGRKLNIIDTVFEMLERYSSNLEELIQERTVELNEERKKTDLLLNRMLPRPVADNLKDGMPVQPEKFEEVTVYFSDIIGFTTISAYSEPMEIVSFLNDLYTAFDSTINNYEVYKVETIGDAYMVVGGLPERRDDHADQIATMALDLLHCCTKFKIRHMPSIPLMLRIGVHTGPVVAGVVGVTMPRYCLFGDTVNTASRMESTGRAYRIHISKATEKKLRQSGGYCIQFRGEIILKGKGKQPTYWLTGKDGFNKELPEPTTEDSLLDNEMFLTIGRQLTDDSLKELNVEDNDDLPRVSGLENDSPPDLALLFLPHIEKSVARDSYSNRQKPISQGNLPKVESSHSIPVFSPSSPTSTGMWSKIS